MIVIQEFYCLAFGIQHFRRRRRRLGRKLPESFHDVSVTGSFHLPAILNIKLVPMMTFESKTRGNTDAKSKTTKLLIIFTKEHYDISEILARSSKEFWIYSMRKFFFNFPAWYMVVVSIYWLLLISCVVVAGVEKDWSETQIKLYTFGGSLLFWSLHGRSYFSSVDLEFYFLVLFYKKYFFILVNFCNNRATM